MVSISDGGKGSFSRPVIDILFLLFGLLMPPFVCCFDGDDGDDGQSLTAANAFPA